jgi:hypothetical protein
MSNSSFVPVPASVIESAEGLPSTGEGSCVCWQLVRLAQT